MLRNHRIRRDVLKYHRLKQHMSQQRLAERAGLSLGQVSRIESGASASPHFQTIEKLAGALGIKEESLIEILLEDPRA